MSLKQQHYRRLMKEQKAKATSVQKVDHPLAKYNALGQLTCVVCTAPIKSEILWNTHLQSRKHKDNVVALKSKTVSSTAGVKRKPPPETVVQDDLPDPTAKKAKTDGETTATLPPDFFDSGIPMETGVKANAEVKGQSAAMPPGVPADFFDKKPTVVENKPNDETPPSTKTKGPPAKDLPPTNSSSLPEGFFDDPKKDAKARKVEYKDPELEEWEKFQKSIQKEDDVSDALILERDMESKEDREETEVQEQATCFLRAEKLRQRQERLVKSAPSTVPPTDTTHSEGGSSDEEVDLDNLLDWRAKVS